MIVLGIDPGYARVGYGVVDYTKNKYRALEYGSITTNADEPLPKRLNKIEKELRKIVSRYKIDSSSIEDLYFNTNTKTAIKVAEARGVILNTLQDCNIPIYEYTPLQAKLAVVGYGRAEKIQVKEMVKQFLNLQQMPKLDDTTDALAIAICHTNSYRLEQCIK
ncbi:MAG: crossover junction endodeoxyribonuclease RuvC [Clostridia bacterium]